MLPQPLDIPLQSLQPAGNGAAILFQLGFTGPPGADAASLAGEAETPTGEPGQAIAQLGQFHLQTPCGAGGPLGKDVQN
jgi:hypothetical protein